MGQFFLSAYDYTDKSFGDCMFKKTLICICVLSLLIIGCKNDKKTEKKVSFSELPYYNSNDLTRYQNYKEIHPNLSDEEIVTRVNIGLDNSFYTNTRETPFLNNIYLLTNKYLYMPSSYIPLNLEYIDENYSSGRRQLVKEARIAFEQMAKNAKMGGFTIRAISAYRSYQYQKDLYQRYVSEDGVENADTYSARPGFSEHQTGLVVDVDNGITNYEDFHNTKEFIWMKNNAYKYGFILRYPEGCEKITGYVYESWHYRYVGIEIATEMKELGLTFDEYYVKYIEISN